MTFAQRVKGAWKALAGVEPVRVKEYGEYELAMAEGGYTVDPDEADYRRVTQSRRDLPPIKFERAVELSYAFYDKDPLAKRLIDLPIEAMADASVEFQADDERVQELWETWFNHPLMGFRRDFLGTKEASLLRDIYLAGEANWPFVIADFTGRIELGYIDPCNIEAILPVAGNAIRMDSIRLKSFSGIPEAKRTIKIVRPTPDGNDFIGDLFHFAINKPVNATRGRPMLFALLDWIDLYDNALFNDVQRWAELRNFSWDVTLKGADDPAIKKFVNERFPNGMAPKPGTVNAHNENETWAAVTPDLKAGDSSELSNTIRKHIGAGRGLADFMLGFSGVTNLATSREMSIPVVWMIGEEQRFATNILTFIFSCVLSKAIAAGRQLESGKLDYSVNREFEIKMPSVFPRDLVQLSSVMMQTVTASQSAVENKFLSRKTAQELTVSAVNQMLGTSKTVDEERELIEAEQTDDDEPQVEGGEPDQFEKYQFLPGSAELARMSVGTYTRKRRKKLQHAWESIAFNGNGRH